MTKQITIPMTESNVFDTFTVSEQFVNKWNDDINNIATYEPSEQDIKDFDVVVDSVYATLTHKQKQALFAEALETYNNVVDFLATQDDITQDLYVVSARKHLATCINLSLCDYCVTMPA